MDSQQFTTEFRLVYDAVSNPALIQPGYWFYSIFWFVSFILVTILAFRWHYGKKRPWSFAVFCCLWIGLTTYASVADIIDTMRVRSAVASGNFRTVEGCLDFFRAGTSQSTKSASDDEYWSVYGIDFVYAPNTIQPGYQTVQSLGGGVYRDARVRVSYVRNARYGRNEIVRLSVARRACPDAPLPAQ